MPDPDYFKELGKKIGKDRIVETDAAVYLVRFDGDRVPKELEEDILKNTDFILSAIGPKNPQEAFETTHLEHFQELFPQTHRLSEKLQLQIGFIWGPVLGSAERKITPKSEEKAGKAEEKTEEQWLAYTLFGAGAVLITWGTKDITRRSFLLGGVKIGLGIISITGLGGKVNTFRAVAKLLSSSGKKPSKQEESIPQQEIIKLPEKLQLQDVFFSVVAETLDNLSLKLREKKKLGIKPCVYLPTMQDHKPLLDYLGKKREGRQAVLAPYKDFLDGVVGQIKVGEFTDVEQVREFYYNWMVYLYTYNNGRWERVDGTLPLFGK